MSILGGNCNKSQFLPKVNQLLPLVARMFTFITKNMINMFRLVMMPSRLHKHLKDAGSPTGERAVANSFCALICGKKEKWM